jgi:hypothetical protein
MINIGFRPDPDIEPGHQWLVVNDDVHGRALATLLTGGVPLVQHGDQILIPHNEQVDRQIMELIDELAHTRFAAPSLVQLTLVENVE